VVEVEGDQVVLKPSDGGVGRPGEERP
jgi:hypothetical protein